MPQVEGIQKMDVRSYVLNPAFKGDSGEFIFCNGLLVGS